MPAGRPTKYKAEYAKQAYNHCLLRATDADLANFFEVEESTIYNWKNTHPDFLEAIKRGREIADQEVAAALKHRAMGYSHSEDKIFLGKDGEPVIVPTTKHYPPDPTAMIFWLKNRQPTWWRDKHEVAHSGSLTLEQALDELEE